MTLNPRRRAASSIGALVVAAVLAVGIAGCSAPASDPPVTSLAPAEYARALFDGTNDARAAEGLEPLAWSDCLVDEAQPRAAAIVDVEELSHEPLIAACDPQSSAGENLARSNESPEAVVDAWLASPGHEANLLSTAFVASGIACVEVPPEAPGQGQGTVRMACSQLFEGAESQQTG